MSTKESQSLSISPPVHLEFIQNQLENISGSAPEEIEQYHRALFLHQHAVEWEKYRQEAKTSQDRIAFLAERVKAAEAQLGSRRKLVPATVDGQEDLKPTSPWNAWDIAMF